MVAERDDAWNLRTPEGTIYGPVPKAQLDQWVREGRVTSDCTVQAPPAASWQQADVVYPALQDPVIEPWTAPTRESQGAYMNGTPAPRVSQVFLVPHRGTLILVLALVGLVVQCPVFSLLAWVLGSTDLGEMRSGRMDPAGEPATRAGRLVGMLLVFVWGIIFCVAAVAVPLLMAVRR